MVSFHTVYALASDGRQKVNGVDNAPTKEQQQQSAKKSGDKTVVDYYRPLQSTHGKYLDWLQKLGCMVIRQQLPDDWDVVSTNPSISYILHDFPTGFTLWEHIKKTNDVDGKSAKSKSHAAGGHDRMDAYLYGHPSKKRYRSPGEFFPHLLWLMTDEKKDRDNCRCVCCSPDAVQPPDVRATASKSETVGKVKLHDVQGTMKAPAQNPEAFARLAKVASTPGTPPLAINSLSQFTQIDPKMATSPVSQPTKSTMTLVQPSPQMTARSRPTSAGAVSPGQGAQQPAMARVSSTQNFQNIYHQPLPGAQQQASPFHNLSQQQPHYGIQAPNTHTQDLSHPTMDSQGLHNQHGMQAHSMQTQLAPHVDYSSAPSFHQYQNAAQIAYGQQAPQDFSMHGTAPQYTDFGMQLGSEQYSAANAHNQDIMDQFIDINGGEYPPYGN